MFYYVHTDKWMADTGYLSDHDEDQGINILKDLKKMLTNEMDTIIEKLSKHKPITDIIKRSVMHHLTITIDVDRILEDKHEHSKQ